MPKEASREAAFECRAIEQRTACPASPVSVVCFSIGSFAAVLHKTLSAVSGAGELERCGCVAAGDRLVCPCSKVGFPKHVAPKAMQVLLVRERSHRCKPRKPAKLRREDVWLYLGVLSGSAEVEDRQGTRPRLESFLQSNQAQKKTSFLGLEPLLDSLCAAGARIGWGKTLRHSRLDVH